MEVQAAAPDYFSQGFETRNYVITLPSSDRCLRLTESGPEFKLGQSGSLARFLDEGTTKNRLNCVGKAGL